MSRVVRPLNMALNLDWREAESAWLESFRRTLGQAGMKPRPHASRCFDTELPQYLQHSAMIELDHHVIRSIHLVLTSPGVIPVIVSDGEVPDALLALVLRALNESVENIVDTKEEHHWRAMAVLRSVDPGDFPVLAEQFDVGGVTVSPVDRVYRDIEMDFWGQMDISFGMLKPIAIEGTSLGSYWEDAVEEAGRRLRDVFSLVSIALDCFCDLKIAPEPPAGETLDWIPEDFNLVGLHRGPTWWTFHERSVPDSLDEMWQRLTKDSIVGDAVNSYYEGLRLTRRHPSYALLAFIGALDSLGRHYESGGNKKRILAATRTLNRPDFTDSIETLYKSLRTRIAHEGLADGPELYLGARLMSGFFHRPPAKDFADGPLALVRSITRQVMLKELTTTAR